VTASGGKTPDNGEEAARDGGAARGADARGERLGTARIALALRLDALKGGDATVVDNTDDWACNSTLELALGLLGAALVAGAAGTATLMARGESLFEDFGGIEEKQEGI
jgi:hypothetical protein